MNLFMMVSPMYFVYVFFVALSVVMLIRSTIRGEWEKAGTWLIVFFFVLVGVSTFRGVIASGNVPTTLGFWKENNMSKIKPKPRCKQTKKAIFRDEKSAGKAMMRIWSHDTSANIYDLHTYVCEFCKGWHIGHKSYYEKAQMKKVDTVSVGVSQWNLSRNSLGRDMISTSCPLSIRNFAHWHMVFKTETQGKYYTWLKV